MICFFCKNEVEYVGSSNKCLSCETPGIRIESYGRYTYVYYEKYQVLLDIYGNKTYIYHNEHIECLMELDGLPITPLNVKDKIFAYTLLS